MNTLALLVVVLATTRLVHLLTDDAILDAPRAWLVEQLPDYWKPLPGCTWCVSIWASAPVAWWAYSRANLGALDGVAAFAAVWFALSYAVVLVEALVWKLSEE